jgi:hypothetical protein
MCVCIYVYITHAHPHTHDIQSMRDVFDLLAQAQQHARDVHDERAIDVNGQIADGVEQILLENHQLEMALTRKHAELAAAESGHVKTCNAILDRIAAEAIDS